MAQIHSSHSGKKGANPSSKPAVVKAPAPRSKARARGIEKPNKKALPVFEARKRSFGIGGNIQPKRDLTRFVRWPKYIRLQRQKSVLLKRLKVPGTIFQFTKAIDKNTAITLFSFLDKYRPESRKQKDARLLETAKLDVKATKGDPKAAASKDKAKAVAKPKVVKYGLNHVTSLVESKKASLVLIAHDVDPIELVLWLPTLCRKKDVPYMVVKSKARLGKVVHKKTASVLAITSVHEGDRKTLENLVSKARDNFLSRYSELSRGTGGQVMGSKHMAAKAKADKIARAAIHQ